MALILADDIDAIMFINSQQKLNINMQHIIACQRAHWTATSQAVEGALTAANNAISKHYSRCKHADCKRVLEAALNAHVMLHGARLPIVRECGATFLEQLVIAKIIDGSAVLRYA